MPPLVQIACATCSLNAAEDGQVLMLVTMIATPIVALGVAIAVVRRLLHKLDKGLDS